MARPQPTETARLWQRRANAPVMCSPVLRMWRFFSLLPSLPSSASQEEGGDVGRLVVGSRDPATIDCSSLRAAPACSTSMPLSVPRGVQPWGTLPGKGPLARRRWAHECTLLRPPRTPRTAQPLPPDEWVARSHRLWCILVCNSYGNYLGWDPRMRAAPPTHAPRLPPPSRALRGGGERGGRQRSCEGQAALD